MHIIIGYLNHKGLVDLVQQTQLYSFASTRLIPQIHNNTSHNCSEPYFKYTDTCQFDPFNLTLSCYQPQFTLELLKPEALKP